ncbi:tyrosine-type recombinase/integrase [Sphingosinicella microcystinivorans]|uniref:Integrase n=1 Tax=Sphingosinicella microcystinivorans TaxID=335406 RepID=A0AAD1D9Y5_SPHMI|nr:integrase arm-type DNA-binding domain-containing protein [Sphingosinicella microcystinivorans]RKS88295.1 integrase [Sphingosinicella microcystinivorans]BBE36107.1 integrase [Sphingosinicella microcystinivorans]
MLSDAKLRAAKPRANAYKLTDSNRLYLLVTPSGGKLWRWSYQYGGKQKTMALGAYPVVSLLEARERRDDARAILSQGKDPVIAKKLLIHENLAAAQNTFERIARKWHDVTKAQWARVHADDVLRSLERDVFPALGPLPVSEISAPLVLDVLRTIEDRGALETAKRVRQRISAAFVYAIAQGFAQHDPSERLGVVLKPLRKGRQPAITDLAELQRMLNAAEEDHARPITRLALRFIALTAVRPNEIRGARWIEFEDLDGRNPLWRIPASRMKGGQDRKEEIGGDHLVPLAHQSVAVLSAIWPLTGTGPLVFPSSRHAHHPMSENAIGYLLNRAGYHGRHVPHGFRAAFSTIMNEWAEQHGKEHDRKIIDLMLAHVPKEKVESAYNRAAYLPRRRELAQIWADMLTVHLPPPTVLLERPARDMGAYSRRRIPDPVPGDFRFPLLTR